MIMVMPISAVMFSSTPVSQSPVNTAVVESSEQPMMISGSQKRSIEEQQQRELRDQGGGEHPRQAGEGDLLLLVQAAQLVAHARRPARRAARAPSDVGDGRADAAPLDAAGDGDHRLQILARDLRLAR